MYNRVDCLPNFALLLDKKTLLILMLHRQQSNKQFITLVIKTVLGLLLNYSK